jgi:hypothetical protein
MSTPIHGYTPVWIDSRTITSLIDALHKYEARVAELEAAILWADGQGDDFPERQPGQGAYWWRRELMQRAGMRAAVLAQKEAKP